MADSAKKVDDHVVTAILVVHDGVTWLPEVVASLASQTRPLDYTLAVDTGSIDDSLKLLKNARVPFISVDRNYGFGEALTAGIEKLPASVSESEWLWFIHDDCAPLPGALAALLEAVQARPQVAIAGPKLRGWYDRTHLLEVGVSIAGNGARWTGLELHEYDQGQRDGIHEVLSVSTAGMLVRRDVFEELGGFDSNLALFRDDVDFGWRARVAGHSVIAVTDAVALHAEASASERRSIDVESAFLHRHLLLDRRNAAYVLLANSSWWLIPWLAIQLFGTALTRALGFLLAKLPGYASDEILAVGSILIHPGEIIKARKSRKPNRLISPRVVAEFIPPRWSQLRMGTLRGMDSLRQQILPSASGETSILDSTNEDEDLLTPAPTVKWRAVFRRPEIIGLLFLTALTTIWSRYRFGSIAGGALPSSPQGAIDLWRQYADSWHGVGMGSASPTPTWIVLVAAASTLFLGKSIFLISAFFWATPILLMLSMYSSLRAQSSNTWLKMGASVSYALSPVAIASVNSGRLGTLVTLILGPVIIRRIIDGRHVEKSSWQTIFSTTLLVGVLAAFSLQAFLAVVMIYLVGAGADFLEFRITRDKEVATIRYVRRLVLILMPLLLCLPWSFEAVIHPTRFLLEPGLALSGGGAHLAWLANPGGVGALPWWVVSPITLVLIVAIFSSTRARIFAELGLLFLAIATLASNLSLTAHGSSTNTSLWIGPLLACATIASVLAGVIILDGLRERLAMTHFHYRHVMAGLVVASTLLYSVIASGWIFTTGANSPVRADKESVLPAFLAVTPGVKTLVIRSASNSSSQGLSFYIARGVDALLGDPDTAPAAPAQVDVAVREIVDGSGLMSSKVLSGFGIKYMFMKAPVDKQFARTVDGLGGFVRNSATAAGIVWRVGTTSERLVFTSTAGNSVAILADPVGTRTFSPGIGTLSLAENFDSSWIIIQDGKKLLRTKSEYGLPQFSTNQVGEFSLLHDGTARRGWLALQALVLLMAVIMGTPARRRTSEISVEELT